MRDLTRRQILGGTFSVFAGPALPTATLAQDQANEVRSFADKLVGKYSLRREWLFGGKVAVPTTGATEDPSDVQWVDPSLGPPGMPLVATVSIRDNRLEIETNFLWSPQGTSQFGPGVIFSARLDDECDVSKQHLSKQLGPRGPQTSHEQETTFHSEKLRVFEGWWVSHSPNKPAEGLKSRTSTLTLESDGRLALRVIEVDYHASRFTGMRTQERRYESLICFSKIPE